MIYRSFLFVPADSEKKLVKALGSDADALIIDLEDSVAADNRPEARELLPNILKTRRDGYKGAVFIRVNPLGSPDHDADMALVKDLLPDGIVLPKCEGRSDVQKIAERLGKWGPAAESIRILPIVTETPRGVLRLPSFAEDRLARLYGLTWGGEDLSAELGASRNKTGGRFTDTFRFARVQTLIAAKAAGAEAVESIFPDFRDLEALKAFVDEARADGFSGMMAIHPAQVAVINDGFLPSDEEVQKARHVLKAVEDSKSGGVASLDGKMIDMPHVKQARHILALHARYSGT